MFTMSCDTTFQSSQNRLSIALRALIAAGGSEAKKKLVSCKSCCAEIIQERGWLSKFTGRMEM